MSLLLMGWKFELNDAIGDSVTDVLIWRSHKDDIIQVKQYNVMDDEISYFKNWLPHHGQITNVETKNGPELLHMYTYKEALILAELRT